MYGHFFVRYDILKKKTSQGNNEKDFSQEQGFICLCSPYYFVRLNQWSIHGVTHVERVMFWHLIKCLNGTLMLCDNCRTLQHKLEAPASIIEKKVPFGWISLLHPGFLMLGREFCLVPSKETLGSDLFNGSYRFKAVHSHVCASIMMCIVLRSHLYCDENLVL